LQEAATLAREYKPLGKVHENLALQTEFARKVLDIAVKGAQDSASTARQSTTEAVKIIQDRMKESFEEFRASVSPNKSA
jgi:phasin family protein